MASWGHTNVMVFTGAASGVVRIQTSGAIWAVKWKLILSISAVSILRDSHHASLHIRLLYMIVGLLMAEKVW